MYGLKTSVTIYITSIRTLDVASLKRHRGRRTTSAGGDGFGEIWMLAEKWEKMYRTSSGGLNFQTNVRLLDEGRSVHGFKKSYVRWKIISTSERSQTCSYLFTLWATELLGLPGQRRSFLFEDYFVSPLIIDLPCMVGSSVCDNLSYGSLDNGGKQAITPSQGTISLETFLARVNVEFDSTLILRFYVSFSLLNGNSS